MFCNNCGGENPNNVKFCKYCGASLMPDFSETSNSSGNSESVYHAPTPEQMYYDAPTPEQMYYGADNQNVEFHSVEPEKRKGKKLLSSILPLCLGAFSFHIWLFFTECYHLLSFTGVPLAIAGLILSILDAKKGANKINKIARIISILGIVLNVYLSVCGWVDLLVLSQLQY